MSANPASDAALSSVLMRHPAGSRLEEDGRNAIVIVPGTAGVALDGKLAQLWQAADGQTAPKLEKTLNIERRSLLIELAALRKAGLLLPPLPSTRVVNKASIQESAPLVSVIIVSRNGRHHLEECLPSLMAQTYSRLEFIVVDGCSTDGTTDFVARQFPNVKILQQQGAPNYAAGNNLGISASSGELIFLLNNDTVLDPECVSELVAAVARQGNVAGAAAMLRFHDNPAFVNGLGTSIRKFGFGYDLGIGSLDVDQWEGSDEVPLLCFGAALIPRRCLDQIGAIDEIYQFYYEDADWSYRARALGYRLIAAPRAKVFHKFGASTGLLPSSFKLRLATRNRLWFVLKNYPWPEVLLQSLLYWMHDVVHLWLHLWRGQRDLIMAVYRAWFEFLLTIPRMVRLRGQTWHDRRRLPVNLSSLSKPFPSPAMHGNLPRLTRETIVAEYGPFLARVTSGMIARRLLIISPDAVGTKMGGVGIRYWELANQLSGVVDVTLAVPQESDLRPDSFEIHCYQQGDSRSLKPVADAADIILLSGFTVYHHPFLRDASDYIVVDLYDPMILENLERFGSRPMTEREQLHQMGVATFNELFSLGDFYICASEKQRDYWLGALTSANRVNPTVYSADPTLRRLIDTVPFGLPDHPPERRQSVLKGVWPGIGKDDKVILWGGGLWDWLDPLTLIKAMPGVIEQVPEARLFYIGTKHPNPDVPESAMALRAIALAEELGLKDTAVFFNEWTPYHERVDYLLEADVGVSLHGEHVETHFSVRTRLMDYFWARLPMVVTGGDVLSELVETHRLGCVVSAGDLNGVSESLVRLLRSPIAKERFDSVFKRFRWSTAVEPLCRYVLAPWRNDAGRKGTAPSLGTITRAPATPWHQLPRKALESIRKQGPRGLWRDVGAYLRWMWQQ